MSRGGGGGEGGGGSRVSLNSVYYADTYHPIQAGSIDGTDILPHDNAVYRALLCSSAGLYDPFGDPKVIGDPYNTIFVGRLSRLTTEQTLLKAMSKYGRVKDLRLVRDIVTGASRGYAFVEFETESDMRRAYKDAHHSRIDDCEVIVDYNRQQLMPGWIPRRLGGGLGGKKESGQLRFGGRERPFRAPLLPVPYDDLKKLGIPFPPEGRYMSRFQIPSPPRREMSTVDKEEAPRRRRSRDRVDSASRRNPVDSSEDNRRIEREKHARRRSSLEREESYRRRSAGEKEGRHQSRGSEKLDYHHESSREQHSRKRRSSKDRDERSHKRHKHRREKSTSTHDRSSFD